MKLISSLALTAAVSLALTGCATTQTHNEQAGYNSAGEINFPEISKAKFSTNNYKGSWPNWSDVAQIEHGMSKDQISALVGQPHFKEGLYNVKQWDYVFNYRDGNNEHKQCQYQIKFDKNMAAEAMFWSSSACEQKVKDAVKPAPQVINNIIQQMPAPASDKKTGTRETIVLGTDALFAFNKYDLNSVNPQGRAQLDALVNKLKVYDQQSKTSIYIVGHTDRLGDEGYNLNLSKNRADSIAAYLLSQGINAAHINTLGAGEYMPVKECSISGTKAQQIECLTPNRRVEIQIFAEQ